VWHRVQAKDGEHYTRRFHEQSAELLDDLIKVRHSAEHLFLIIMEMSNREPQKLKIVSDSPYLAGMVTGALHELAVNLGYERSIPPEDEGGWHDDFFLDF
jgi:hypothetical protein